jgi:putative hydrolase of the HAD superfamily
MIVIITEGINSNNINPFSKSGGFSMKFSHCIKRILLFICTINTIYSAPIIFDLGQVLVFTDSMAALGQVGFVPFLGCALNLQNPLQARVRIFEILEKIPAVGENYPLAYDDHGRHLPNIMCDWLSGTQTPEIIYEQVLRFVDEHPYEFKSSWEQEVICRVARLMFTPENFAKTRKIYPAAIKFVQSCIDSGHTVYILSNWDAYSFDIMKNRYPEFFNLFEDRIVISGTTGTIKPDVSIFQYLLTRFNLNPIECIFIDDRPENIAAAQNLNMHTILCEPKKNFLGLSRPDYRWLNNQINAIICSRIQAA